MIDLKGKRALVTGGSRGIGAATSLLLAECGADVGIGYRNREKDAEDVVRRIASLGVRGFAHAADISTVAGTESLFARAARELGGLDLFVGNAGIWPFDDVPIGEMDDDRWHTTMRVNLDSMFTTTPFLSPFDSCPPMPRISSAPSGLSSATRQATLEVPMSRATIRFLFSLGIRLSL